MITDEPGGSPANCNEPHGGENMSKNTIKNVFNVKSKAPFNIFIQIKEESNIDYISPLLIGRELTKAKIQEIKTIKKLNKKRVMVEFNTFSAANYLVYNFEKVLNNSYVAFVPSHLIQCKGVIRIDKDMSENEVEENLETDNFKLLKVRRIQKRIIENGSEKRIDTSFMELIFEGTVLPRSVNIYKNPIFVKRPNNPIKICHKCLFFGHVEKWCKSTNNRCKKCSSKEHSSAECSSEAYCLHCKSGDHSPNTDACMELMKQKNINEIMWTNNVTFAEARRIYFGADNLQSSTFHQAHNDFPNTLRRIDNTVEIIPRSPPTKITKGAYSQVAKNLPNPQQRHQNQPTYPYPRDLLYRANQYPSSPIINNNQDRPVSKRKYGETPNSSQSQSEDLMVPLRKSIDSFYSSPSCGSSVATLCESVIPMFIQIFSQFKKEDLDPYKKKEFINSLQSLINSIN